MLTNEELRNGLQNMVVNSLSDRYICDQSAILLLVLETEVKFLTNQIQELQNESI